VIPQNIFRACLEDLKSVTVMAFLHKNHFLATDELTINILDLSNEIVVMVYWSRPGHIVVTHLRHFWTL
jgi:hypothetical protein